MQFDVNINATLDVDEDTWNDLVDVYRQYADWDDADLEAEGVSEADVQADIEQAEDQAEADICSDLDGYDISSQYGNGWVCSADITLM